MIFRELTDEQWQRVEVILTGAQNTKNAKRVKGKISITHKRKGRPPVGQRKVLNGILYVLLTGCAWNKIPPEYGTATTCWRRFKKWSEDGTWMRIWRELLTQYDEETKQLWANALLNGYFHPCKLPDRLPKTQDTTAPKRPSKRGNIK